MKNLAIATLAVTALAASMAAEAQVVLNTQSSVQLLPAKARYKRGEVVTFVYSLRINGRLLPNETVYVGDGWGEATGWTFGFFTKTDGNGQVRRSYRIPTSAFADNVYIFGYFGGLYYPGLTIAPSNASWRIPIGS